MKLKPVRAKDGVEQSLLFEARVPKKCDGLLETLVRLSYKNYACLVPFTLDESKLRPIVTFNAKSLVPLPQYLSIPVDSEQFIVLLESLLRAFAELDEIDVSTDFVSFDLDYLFVNAVKGSIAFVLSEGDRERREQFPSFGAFRALGALPEPSSFETRELMRDYVSGLDAIIGEGLPGYRGYAQLFVNAYRGEVPAQPERMKSSTQNLSSDAFYDAAGAAERTEADLLSMASIEGKTGPVRAKSIIAVELVTVSDGSTRSISQFPYVLGASQDADYVISGNQWISRKHARLECEGRAVYLKDTESTNGTALNGKRLQRGQRVELSDGDEFDLAGECFKVMIRIGSESP